MALFRSMQPRNKRTTTKPGARYGNVPSNYYGNVSDPGNYKRYSRGAAGGHWQTDTSNMSILDRMNAQKWDALSSSERERIRKGGGNVETPLGTFGAEDWQQRAMYDLAGTQREQMLAHSNRLRQIAQDVAQRGGSSATTGQEIPGLVSMLNNYLRGDVNIQDIPAFQGSADYIERAVRRTNAALGYNMSGNVANAVGENLQQYSTDVYNSQVQNMIAALNSQSQTASLFPSEIYSDLLSQASQVESQQYDPYGNVVGYVSELATGAL